MRTPLPIADLEQAARRAAKCAYVPYSKFPVGAAVLTAEGGQFSGCNVENASYGLTNCAERTAIFQAVAAGHRRIVCLVIYTGTSRATTPCGACRQVLREFGEDVHIVSICDTDHRLETSLAHLLPDSFGSRNLGD